MKFNIKKTMLLAATLSLVAGMPTQAKGDTELVYRNSDGSYPQDSKLAINNLYRAASSFGFVELWLSLDTQGLFGDKPVSDAQYLKTCTQILRPLAAKGRVSHPSKGLTNFGSRCFVRANAAGVSSLTQDQRFIQIMGTTHAH